MLTLPTVFAIGLGALMFFLGFVAGFLVKSRPVVVIFPAPEPAGQDSPLVARARILVADAERANASGEYKRHQVYARLLKEFPAERRRGCSKAIEKAMDDVP